MKKVVLLFIVFVVTTQAEVPEVTISRVPMITIEGGNLGSVYGVYTSSNLNSWNIVDTLRLQDEPTIYFDSSASGVSRRFYQLKEILLETEGLSTSAFVDEAEVAGDMEEGIFEIEVQVTAFGSDVWIPDKASNSGPKYAGFVFSIEDSGIPFSGNIVSYISETTSSVNENGRLLICENCSEHFTIRVELDPTGAASGGAFGIELNAVQFSVWSNSQVYDVELPDSHEFETKKVVID